MERKGHRSICRYDGEVCDWSRTSSGSTRRSKRQSSQGSFASTQGKLQRDEWLKPQHVEQASLRHIESGSEIESTPSSPSLQECAGMEQAWDAKPRTIPLEWVWESQSVSELDSVASSPSLQEDADTDYVRKKEPIRIPLECSCEFHSIGESQSLPSCTSNRKHGGTMDIFRAEPLRIPLEMTHVVTIPQLEDPRYLEKQTLQEDYLLENRSPYLAREHVKSREDYNAPTCNERSKIQRRWHITATSTSCALQDPRESQGRYATIGNRCTRVATDCQSPSQRTSSVEECSEGASSEGIEYSSPSSSMAGLSPLECSPTLSDEERRRSQEAYVSYSTERTVAPVDTHVMSWRLHLAEGIIRTSVSDSTTSIGPADGPLEYPHALGMRIKNGMVRTLRQSSKESEELGIQMQQLKLRVGERCRLDRLAIKEMREFIQELREKRRKM